jgi:dihydropteroate synthase
MGIVNVTPDSFSDGGRYFDPQAAIEHGLQLVAEGADLLDIGGESTRPYATPVDADEELRRVMPVVAALCEQVAVPISIDTSKANVADEALAAGVEIINDVTGFQADPALTDLVVESGAGVCVMHMQGNPQTMQDQPTYDNVVREVFRYLAGRRDALRRAGVAAGRICLDPGIGFGKTYQHNMELLARCGTFHDLGCPVLVGHSRKGFLSKILNDPQANRTAVTIGVALALGRQGIQLIRVHDVGAVREALIGFQAVGGFDP